MEVQIKDQQPINVFIQLIRLADEYIGYGDGIGVIFGGRRILFYRQEMSSWEIMSSCDQNTIEKCELILCEKESISEGDTVFVTNDEEPTRLYLLSRYCKVISDSLVSPSLDGGITISDFSEWKYWYKVVCNE